MGTGDDFAVGGQHHRRHAFGGNLGRTAVPRGLAALCLLALCALAATAIRQARAQEPNARGTAGEIFGQTGFAESQVVPFTDDEDILGDYPPFANDPRDLARNIWLNAGPVFGLGGGFFDDTDLGWSIQLLGRQPISPRFARGYAFLELGGSFLSLSGDGNPQVTSGTFLEINSLFPASSTVTRLDDFFSTELVDLSRASADVALGWSHFTAAGGQWTFRTGGRIGHIAAQFHDTPTASLQALIDAATGSGNPFTLNSNYAKRDTFAGMFFGCGWESPVWEARWSGQQMFLMQLGTRAEFAYDWIDLENFQDSSLGSVSVLLGLTISR